MNKKVISLIIAIMLILTMFNTTKVYAEEATANVNISVSTTKISENQKEVEVIISLGNLQNLVQTSGNLVLGYESVLEFDKNIFESATVEGMNGWTANYSSSTNKLIGDISNAKANTDITKITLKVKDGVAGEISGNISIKNLMLTDGTNEFAFNKEFTITTVGNSTNVDINNTANETGNNNNASSGSQDADNTSGGSNNTIPGNNTNRANSSTNTTGATRLPSAGTNGILIITIMAVIVLAIIFKIKSRKIKY